MKNKCVLCGHGTIADGYGEELTCLTCKGTGEKRELKL